MRLRRALKDGGKRALGLANVQLERSSFRLQPVHYYSETPSRRGLAATHPDWALPLTMSGIDWDLDAQVDWVRSTCEPYIGEVEGLRRFHEATMAGFGPGYGPIESLLLHCVVRHVGPSQVLEIGSGTSSVLTEEALRRNRADARDGHLTCVEPFPRQQLREIPGIELHEVPAQRAPVALFEGLRSGDVLFVDSTHAVKTGSELARIYLEILPRLPPGVLVHIHDIFLPFTYPPDIMANLFDWQESTLLAALLSGNRRFRVLACLSALHDARAGALREIFSDYRPAALTDGLFAKAVPDGHFPSSIWLEVRGEETPETPTSCTR